MNKFAFLFLFVLALCLAFCQDVKAGVRVSVGHGGRTVTVNRGFYGRTAFVGGYSSYNSFAYSPGFTYTGASLYAAPAVTVAAPVLVVPDVTTYAAPVLVPAPAVTVPVYTVGTTYGYGASFGSVGYGGYGFNRFGHNRGVTIIRRR